MYLENEKIVHNNFETQLIEDRIFYLYFLPNSHSSEKEYRLAYEAYNDLRQGKTLFVIVEHGSFASLDKSAREYLQNNKFEAKASVIIMHSLPQRILYNFYLKFRKQTYPIKSFSNTEDAIKWFDSLEL